MPTYEYRCKSCAREFEIVQSFSDDALTTCNECGGPLRKLFGNVGISFKGDGFYKNDHGANARSKPADSSSSDTSSSDGSTSDSSSTKSSDTTTTSTETKSSDTKASPASSSTSTT